MSPFWTGFSTGALSIGVACLCTVSWKKLWKEAHQAKREFQKDLITRLTARRLSLVWDQSAPRGEGFAPPPNKWQVISPQGHLMAASIHWQRAAQIALDGIGPAPGCDSCRGDADAIAGKPYAICQNCGRTLLYLEPEAQVGQFGAMQKHD
jgi:hypothetical protein